MDRLCLDFETRSVVPFGKAKGAVNAYQYARHPSTSVWCMAWAINDGEVHLWDAYGDEPFPDDVVYALREGLIFQAFNAGFEWNIWNGLLVRRYGLPPLPFEQMDCTAARAAVMALPRSLEGAGAAMGLAIQKDDKGSRLMKQMAKPRKPRKGEDPDAILWWDDDERRQRLGEYCIRDVETERALGKVVLPLTKEEREVWLLDHKTNNHGVMVDVEFTRKARKVMAVVEQRYCERLATLTDFSVSAPTEIANMRSWLADIGVETDSLDKGSVIKLLDDPEIPEDAREVLSIRQAAGKSSVAKLVRFEGLTSPDGRMRNNFLYHGANTGRLAGMGAQLQNLPSRGGLGWKDAEAVINLVLETEDPEWAADRIELLHGEVPTAMSSCLRGVIQAPPGKQLFVADYSNIEGRVAAWLGNEAWKLQAFRAFDAGVGPDLYKVTAGGILGKSPEQVDGTERNIMGKVPELALGFGGGVGAFQSMAKNFNVQMADYWDIIQASLDEVFVQKAFDNWDRFGKKSGLDQPEWLASEAVKVGWRARHQGIVRSWYDAEDTARKALKTPGKWFKFADGKCAHGAQEYGGVMFLISRLPSGRRTYRAHARLKPVTKFGRATEQIEFMGVDSITRQWVRMSTYGGDLYQTCLASGTLVLTDLGWKPIESITPEDRLWDGQEWVVSEGAINNGLRRTIPLSGVRMTPDHLVLTHEGWKEASSSAGHHRAQSRLPDSGNICGLRWEEIPLAHGVCLRSGPGVSGSRTDERGEKGAHHVVRVSSLGDDSSPGHQARDVPPQRVRRLGFHARQMLSGILRKLPALRRAGHSGLRLVARQFHELLGGHGADLPGRAHVGEEGCERRLHSGELRVGDVGAAGPQPPEVHKAAERERSRDSTADGDIPEHAVLQAGPRLELGGLGEAPRLETVYDIVNCGPRNRFVVRGDNGQPIIVHNCVQAIARDIMVNGWRNVERKGFDVVLSVHDEVGAEADEDRELSEFEAEMIALPDWATGLPVSAEGYKAQRYRKD